MYPATFHFVIVVYTALNFVRTHSRRPVVTILRKGNRDLKEARYDREPPIFHAEYDARL